MISGKGLTTLRLAEAVFPVPPSVELTAPVTLFWTPTVVPVTFTEMVHVPLGAKEALASVTEPEPATAVIVGSPQPLLVKPLLELATVKPTGSVSLNPTPLKPLPLLGLVMVKVRLVELPTPMMAAPKALVIKGGAATTRVAIAVLPVPPLVEVTMTLLFMVPTVVPVTFNEKVQLPPGARYP